jgi:acyl-CoA thioesterase
LSFAAATAVRSVGDGTWAADIAAGWDVAGNANGGYLMAMAARAMAGATGRPDPVSVTAHYLAPGRPGPVTVGVSVVRAGRRFATAAATVADGERPLITAVGTFTDFEAAERGGEADLRRVEAAPPELPPVEECPLVRPAEPFPPPFTGRVELRLHPDDARFVEGRPSGRLAMRGWFRLPGGEPVGTLGLLQAADAFPPTAFNAALPVAWTPTLELTVHVRARPAEGWLRCAFTTRFVVGGFLEEDGEIWDATGALVAQCRQLALVPRPAAGGAAAG